MHRCVDSPHTTDDPYLELIRLLKEGSEIEQDLMVQYLYSAYALKPEYAATWIFWKACSWFGACNPGTQT